MIAIPVSEIAGILLAAGSSKRFGSDKRLHRLPDDMPIGVRSARNLILALPDSIAVVRPGDQKLIDEFSDLGLRVIVNTLADQGMGTSLALGVSVLRGLEGCLVALADMPWINVDTIRSLSGRIRNGASIVAPVYQGQRGHPVGFSRKWFDKLYHLSGDKGAQELIAANPGEIELLRTGDIGVVRDVDYPVDLAERMSPIR